MFAHPYVAILIARERERGMLNAAARQRLARQAAHRPTTRGAAFRAVAARVRGAWPDTWWRGGGCWQLQNGAAEGAQRRQAGSPSRPARPADMNRMA